MSIVLRVFLFVGSVATFLFIMRIIRKSKVRIEDTLFWIMLSIVLVLCSVVPALPMAVSRLLRVESPANFVFMLIIFVLLVNQFRMAIHQSQTEMKLRELVQRIALDEEQAQEQLQN